MMKDPLPPTLDFQTLYKKHFHGVRAVVSRFRFADAAQDDLVQDIFVQAWQNIGSLKDSGAFSAWLMTIARNRCLTELRRTQRNVSIAMTDSMGDNEDGSMEVVLVANDEMASLHFEHSTILLRQLIEQHEGEPRATVARMFYLEEKAVKDIVAALSLNQNTVLSHLRRFRLIVSEALLNLLEEKGIEIH